VGGWIHLALKQPFGRGVLEQRSEAGLGGDVGGEILFREQAVCHFGGVGHLCAHDGGPDLERKRVAKGALDLQRETAAIGQSRLWNGVVEESEHGVFP